MNTLRIMISCLLAAGLLSSGALAQTMVIGGGQLQIGPDQQLMFDAAKKVVNRDYHGAETIYNQVIAMNGHNIDAYVQRGIVRREQGNAAGAAADGKAAVTLADASLANNANNPMLYYQRGMGYRLLKNYAQAKQDVATGIKLGGSENWNTDIQAINLEEKENNSR